MSRLPGTALSIESQGEGWFPLGPPVICGSIVSTIASTQPFYVVRLEAPLEVQERADDTPSRLRLRCYEYAVVSSRWEGVDVGAEERVSTHVRLVPQGSPLPSTPEGCNSLPLRVWATCRVQKSFA